MLAYQFIHYIQFTTTTCLVKNCSSLETFYIWGATKFWNQNIQHFKLSCQGSYIQHCVAIAVSSRYICPKFCYENSQQWSMTIVDRFVECSITLKISAINGTLVGGQKFPHHCFLSCQCSHMERNSAIIVPSHHIAVIFWHKLLDKI